MSDESQFLSQTLKRSPLVGDDALSILRRLLRTQAEGAADVHFKAGVALFSAADTVSESEKRLLYSQIFFCLMRALEDFAMLCLMGWDESRHPLDIYLNLDRPELRAFFSRARKGLGDEMIFKLMGIGSWPALKRLAAFRNVDFSSDESALDWAAQDAREMLVRFGKLYHINPDEADTELGPWQLAFAKAPIGMKLLLGDENAGPEILMGSEQGDPAKHAPATLFSAPVNLNTHFAERVLHELEGVCRELKRLARRRLMLLDDSTAVARGAKAEWQEHLRQLAAGKGKSLAVSESVSTPASSSAVEPAPSPHPNTSSPTAPVGSEEEVHVDPRHDTMQHKIMEVGGLKIIHSKTGNEE